MADVVVSDHTRQDIQLPNDVASKAQESSVSHKKNIYMYNDVRCA